MNRSSPNPDPLDRLMQGYFQQHMPRTWPGAPVPVEIARHRTPVASRGRWTLAAAVAALLVFGAMIPYSPQQPTVGPGSIDDAIAGPGNKFNKHVFPERQPKLPGTQP